MIAEFNWWLLIVGVIGGGALTWLVLADSNRREREIGDEELAAEATWIARTVQAPGVDADTAEEVLRAHRRYLGFPPPDVLVAPEELDGAGTQPLDGAAAPGPLADGEPGTGTTAGRSPAEDPRPLRDDPGADAAPPA